MLGEDIIDSYLDTVAGLAADGPRDLAVVYTPLHGVGGTSVVQVLETAGFSSPQVVEAQEQPDADFPTVAFPNPEEPGAMDLALALAERSGADIVVANDPDADRCAAAIPGPDGWRMLRGDEVGALLASPPAAARQARHLRDLDRVVVAARQAGRGRRPEVRRDAHRLQVDRPAARTWRSATRRRSATASTPSTWPTRTASPRCSCSASSPPRPKAAGRGLQDLLDDIAVEHGLHATDQVSVRVSDLGEIATAMARLRETPPASLGGLAVEHAEDLQRRRPATLPPTDGLRYHLADGARVIVRPSGTEPKLKCYLEVVVPVADGDVAAARAAAATTLAAMKTDFAAAAGIGSGTLRGAG